jgi:hypothetical protein
MGRVYRAWLKLGAILHRITSPIVLAILFYAVMTPMGWIMKALGHDFLSLKLDDKASSYWVERNEDRSAAENMNHQF